LGVKQEKALVERLELILKTYFRETIVVYHSWIPPIVVILRRIADFNVL